MPSKVLIVDDDRATRYGLSELLEGAGYDTVAVGTFEEAIRLLPSAPPDLLIADVRLGPFNGLQLVISSPRPVPAIIITGFADPVLEADARRRGAEYVLKPIAPTRLLELVGPKICRRACRVRHPAAMGTEASHRWAPASVGKSPLGSWTSVMAAFGSRSDAHRSAPSRVARHPLPSAKLSVKAELVWKNPIGSETWMCGASLSQETPEWYGLVDAI